MRRIPMVLIPLLVLFLWVSACPPIFAMAQRPVSQKEKDYEGDKKLGVIEEGHERSQSSEEDESPLTKKNLEARPGFRQEPNV